MIGRLQGYGMPFPHNRAPVQGHGAPFPYNRAPLYGMGTPRFPNVPYSQVGVQFIHFPSMELFWMYSLRRFNSAGRVIPVAR